MHDRFARAFMPFGFLLFIITLSFLNALQFLFPATEKTRDILQMTVLLVLLSFRLDDGNDLLTVLSRQCPGSHEDSEGNAENMGVHDRADRIRVFLMNRVPV